MNCSSFGNKTWRNYFLRNGEKVALDGELLSEKASFNSAALTGESKPVIKNKMNLFMQE